jgi:hypothetical protein
VIVAGAKYSYQADNDQVQTDDEVEQAGKYKYQDPGYQGDQRRQAQMDRHGAKPFMGVFGRKRDPIAVQLSCMLKRRELLADRRSSRREVVP